MSSYVISKRDYIRAAGLLAGIAEFYNRTPYELWLYDYEHRRNMTTPDYHEQFTRLFELNAESVAWQYGDEAPKKDDDRYDLDFKRYMQNGKRDAMRGPVCVMAWTKKLNAFFASALYQTEKPDCSREMETFFGRVIRALLRRVTTDEDSAGFWGGFNEDDDPAPRVEPTPKAAISAADELSTFETISLDALADMIHD